MEEDLIKQEIEDIRRIEAYGFQPGSFEQLSDDTIAFNLFEGNRLEIELSIQGFKIVSTSPPHFSEGKTFESIDSLLSNISPLYQEKFSSLLFDGLTKLQ